MKRLWLPLAEYEKDLQESKSSGRKEASRGFIVLLKMAKHEPRAAVNLILDSPAWTSSQQKEVIELLGLAGVAEAMFKEEGIGV